MFPSFILSTSGVFPGDICLWSRLGLFLPHYTTFLPLKITSSQPIHNIPISGLRTTPTSTLRNDGTKHTMRKSPYLVSLIFLLAATTLTILNIYVSFLAAGKRRLDV